MAVWPVDVTTLNDSPIQRKLRDEAAWFSGVVYWQPGDYDPDHVLWEFRRIRQLGFNMVRFHTADPKPTGPGTFDFTRTDDWLALADKADLLVIPHLPLVPDGATLEAHGLTPEAYAASYLDDDASLAALDDHIRPMVEHLADHPRIFAWTAGGEPNAGQADLSDEEDRRRFGEWLRGRYGTVEALDAAWNLYPERGTTIVPSFEEAWQALAGFSADPTVSGAHRAKVNYGAARDMVRFFTDKFIARERAKVECFRRYDPSRPVLIGSHQLLVNQPALRWDLPAWARLADSHFTSIHMAWHFELAEGEVDHPLYVQARQTHDYLKGCLTSCYETTGGAVQYSGGYGNAMTAGLMRRLCLTYLAAGNLSMAFWTWNHRPGGWEAGEYGMISLSGRITPWAEEAGRVANGMEAHAEELWAADPEPEVGVLESWDTQAILNFEPERHDLKPGHGAGEGRFGTGTPQQFGRARLGVARALVDGHVPFEFLTTDELAEGVAGRYPTIYAPHLRALPDETIDALEDYVRAGGRLVADVQFGFMDPWGKVRPTGEGGQVERLFGAWVDVIHDTRPVERSVAGAEIDGFYGTLEVTRAEVVARFDDGRPAVTECELGKGTAVLVGFDAARMCHRPGREDIQSMITRWVRGDRAPAWTATAPMAHRLRAPSADHWFLLTGAAGGTVQIEAADAAYASVRDVLTGEELAASGGKVAAELPDRSGLWLRCERAETDDNA